MRVFCSRSMHAAVAALVGSFAGTSTGGGPDIVFEPMGALMVRLASGETADVLILAAPTIDALADSGLLLPGSRTAIARAPIGVAVRDGAVSPDISTAEAFLDSVKAARAIALSDPAVGGTAGIYLRDLFERLGLADLVAERAIYRKSGVAAADAVAHGDADLALSFIPELLQSKGVRVLGALPPPYGHAPAYAAGVPASCAQQDDARAFIAALTDPDAASVWTAAGFELGA